MISGWAGRTFDALGDRHYRVLWIGTTFMFLAFSMSMVVQSVVAYEITGKNSDVGVVAFGQGIAMLIVAPFGGVVADRLSKRNVLLGTQFVITAVLISVGLLIVTDLITIALLVGSTFLMGITFSFMAPARQAWVGDLLDGPRRANGIALQQVAMTATRIVGPFLAGLLVAISFIGSGGAYLVMALLVAVGFVTVLQLPKPPKTGPRASSAFNDFKLGFAHLRERPRLALVSLLFIGVVLGGFSYHVILPGLLVNALGRSSSDMAWLLGMAGLAGFIGTIGVAGFAQSHRAWAFMFFSAGVLGAGLVSLAFVPSYALALPVMFVVGAGGSVFQMMNNAIIVREADPAFFGRVMTVVMLAWGVNGMSGAPYGVIADAVGERSTLVVMGAIVVGVTLVSMGALQAIGGSRHVARAAVTAETTADSVAPGG
jgi:MFS family permease